MHSRIEKELANNRVAAIITSIEWNDTEGGVVIEHYADLVRLFGGNYMLRVFHSDTEKAFRTIFESPQAIIESFYTGYHRYDELNTFKAKVMECFTNKFETHFGSLTINGLSLGAKDDFTVIRTLSGDYVSVNTITGKYALMSCTTFVDQAVIDLLQENEINPVSNCRISVTIS